MHYIVTWRIKIPLPTRIPDSHNTEEEKERKKERKKERRKERRKERKRKKEREREKKYPAATKWVTYHHWCVFQTRSRKIAVWILSFRWHRGDSSPHKDIFAIVPEGALLEGRPRSHYTLSKQRLHFALTSILNPLWGVCLNFFDDATLLLHSEAIAK